MPVDKKRYGSNWKKISKTIRRIAGNRCEFCGVSNGSALRSGRQGKVILTVAHLGVPFANGANGNKHDKHDVRRENLKALCQACHLREDIDEHIENAKKTRNKKKLKAALNAGQLSLMEEIKS